MADSNLETSGVRLVAEGADKYVNDLGRAGSAGDKLDQSLKKLAANNTSGLDGAASAAAKLGASANGASTALGGLGSAGGAAGTAIVAGLSAAIPVLGLLITIGTIVITTLNAIGQAVSAAVAYGSSIRGIQDSTGLGAGNAQSLFGAAAIGGTSISGLTNTVNAFGKAAEAQTEKAAKGLAKVGAAADKADTRLARLNEDYARSVADINESAAERVRDINERLVESHAAMLERQARADEDYARESGEIRANLAQRIADIDASTSDSVARLTERQSRLTDDYARETESARDDLARSILDIETDLADSIEALQYRAAQQNTDAINDGAKAQTQIQENLQKELYSIEQKYNAKRQGLQDKIYDPNTNPILRAYYKTQLKSLDGLQKAETDGARSTAQAKAEQARRETEVRLSEIERGLARETALEQREADRRRAREQEDAARRQAERLREYNQQSGDLAAQIARENAQRDQQIARARLDATQRETDLKRSYDQNTADAKAAYDKQVRDAAEAQLKIQAETTKRLAAEKLQYDRALEDIKTALANSFSGGALAAEFDKVARGFDTLGISAEAFQKLKPDEQFKLINDRVAELIASGNGDLAIQMIQDITGVSREMAVQYVRSVGDMKAADQYLKDLGWTQEQIDNAVEVERQFNLVKAVIGQVGADIGAFFIPAILELFRVLGDLWRRFKDDLLPALKNTYNFIKDNLEKSFTSLKEGAGKLWDKLEPVRKVVDAIANVAMAALDLKAREIEAFWTKYLYPIIEDVGEFLEDHIAPVLRDIGGGILNDFNTKFETAKGIFQWLYDHLGDVATFFNNIATNISGISLPSWLQPNGSGGLTPTITYPTPPSGYGNPYGTGASPYSIPATPAQTAAGKSTGGTTNSTSNVANVTVNVTSASKAAVSSGVVDGLFKAGFKVSK